MSNLLTAVSTGITAFSATNLDDIVILMLFFSQVNTLFRHKHIVMGQYLGFAALVFASLPGFFGGLLVPQAWIGMLGIVPIAIGVSRLLNSDEEEEDSSPSIPADASPLAGLLSPQTYSVAAVTFANGGDNVGIYVPLFASCTWESLVVILSVFFSLVGVWCYAAQQLTRVSAIGNALTHYGNQLVPFVLMGLGAMILLESHTLEDRGLMVLTLLVSGVAMVMLQIGKAAEVEKSL
ncbi:cadmium resistance transporter [Phormidium tenue FACHB-886]|nr:cadmium resistance transporter [Phormidium tenue FACHB-886]